MVHLQSSIRLNNDLQTEKKNNNPYLIKFTIMLSKIKKLS